MTDSPTVARAEDVTRAPCGNPQPFPSWPSQCRCGWLIAEHGQEKAAQDLEQEKVFSPLAAARNDARSAAGSWHVEPEMVPPDRVKVAYVTDVTVVQVEPGEQHTAWLNGIHELKERLGVRGITSQSSGVLVSVGEALRTLSRSWDQDHQGEEDRG